MSGVVIWFTGLPASGKSTLARRVSDRLGAEGRACVVLDSDEIRRELTPQLGYSVAERNTFYDMLARLAATLARQGLVVLVAATAHRRHYRDWARAFAPRYFEVFIDVPVEECRRRDPKGLYKRAATSRASSLPGSGTWYEAPERPDVVAHGGEDDVVEQIAALASPKEPTVTAAAPPMHAS